MSERKALVTWVNGPKALEQWAQARPSFERYAKLVGADLVIMDDGPDSGHPLATKLRVKRYFDTYDRILFADSDVLFGPDSPDLFAETPPGCIGIREEVFASMPEGRAALTMGLTDVLMAAGVAKQFQAIDVPHFNSGVYVLPKQFAAVLDPVTFPLPTHHCAEQDLMRWRIHRDGIPVHRFKPEDCPIWATDCRDLWARTKGVKHFAGVPGPRGRHMAVEILSWSECKPSGKCALVIGHFGMPGAVRMQIALNRRHLNVPMLVTDDWTWESHTAEEGPAAGIRRHEELLDVCEWSGAHLRTANMGQRCKHAGGDLGALWHGIRWAAEHGIEYLLKLSMRAFVHGMDNYLQEAVAVAERKHYRTGTHLCKYGGQMVFQIRSEIVLMHVPTWSHPLILHGVSPRPNVGAAELIVADVQKNLIRSTMYALPWFGPDRSVKYPNLWWHDNYEHNPAEGEAEARAIGKRYGVDLGAEFHSGVSGQTKGYIGF